MEQIEEDRLDELGSNRKAGYRKPVPRLPGAETKPPNPAKNDPERCFIEL